MKIAILIAGEYREFAIAHKSWTFLNWPDVDCYFSTWAENYRVFPDIKINQIRETVTVEDIHSLIRVVDLDVKELDDNTRSSKCTTWKMIDRWKSALSLLKKSNIHYDRVILIRPDIALEYDEELFKNFVYESSASDNDLYGLTYTDLNTPFPLKERGQMCDLMLLGTQNSILKLLDLPTDEFFSIENGAIKYAQVDVHNYLAKFCLVAYDRFLNMPIKDQCIVRTNCRTLVNPSFYEYKLKAKEWWEIKYKKFFSMGENVWDYGLYHRTHPECIRHREFTTTEINLWEKFEATWLSISMRAGMPWCDPDTEERYLRRVADKANKNEITYGPTEINYNFNSFGFRTDSGPQEFEDVGDNPCMLVGGCSITEGTGLPEHHLWHSFLYNKITEEVGRPIAKFNLGKGGISIGAIIRYIYISIEHYNLKPDMVYILLPTIHRVELISKLNNGFIYHHIPNQPVPGGADPELIDAIKHADRNTNYRSMYHDCFKNLLLLKWFLAAKNIPWFFSFWADDFDKDCIKHNMGINEKDVNLPPELMQHYIRAVMKYMPDLKLRAPEACIFPHTIARDYAHFGPNSHVDLANIIYDKLLEKEDFKQVLNKWRKYD